MLFIAILKVERINLSTTDEWIKRKFHIGILFGIKKKNDSDTQFTTWVNFINSMLSEEPSDKNNFMISFI